MVRERAQVVIVGAGPVGLTLANLLGIYGIGAVLIERNTTTVAEPRAVAIDVDAMRTFQAIGLDEELSRDALLGLKVDYVNGQGRCLFALDMGPTAYGHALQNSLDQPFLERALQRGLDRFPHVAARFGHTVLDVSRTPGSVLVRGARGEDASGEPFEVEADYLIGCDGGRSLVRKAIGVRMLGRTEPERWLVVDTVDPHLADQLDCRFFCDPARPGMTIRKRHGRRRWEWLLLPREPEDTLLSEAAIRALIAPFTAADQVTIERKRAYTFHSLVAERYREGRIFLAGDAAHMMPPFAGQGLNTGIRDAFNLAWKLGAVLRGAAPEALLDSYEEERRGQAVAAIRLARWLGAIIQPTGRVRATIRDALFSCIQMTDVGRRVFARYAAHAAEPPELGSGVFVRREVWCRAARLSGRRLIQPRVRDSAGRAVGLDRVLGPGFAVLGYGQDPLQAIGPDARAAWERLGARFVHVVPQGAAPAGGAVEDLTGALAPWFRDHEARMVAVRPDRVCAAQFPGAAADAAARAFHRRMRGEAA